MTFHRGIASRFSRAAETYAESAEVQREVVDELMARLPSGSPARILEIGCGTGHLTEKLLTAYPQAQIDAIDIAPGMIDFCRRNFEPDPRLHWQVCDVLEFRPAGKYDLIVSSSAIHWVSDLQALFVQLRTDLAEGGTLAFSLMLENTFHELYDAKRAVVSDDKIGARLPSFEQVELALNGAELHMGVKEKLRRTVVYDSAQSFFADLRAQGVNSGRAPLPLRRGELTALMRTYEQMFRTGKDAVPATYECGLFICS